MKKFFKVFFIVLLHFAMLFSIFMLLHPSLPDECLALSNQFKTARIKFRSAERFFYLEAKRQDDNLKKNIKDIETAIENNNYEEAKGIATHILARYPDQTGLLEKIQKEEAVFLKKQKEEAVFYFETKDYKKALEFLENADKKDTDVLYMSGFIYANDSNLINYQKAFQNLNAAAQSSTPEILYELARLYEKGYGVTQDMKVAISLYEKNVIKQHLPSIQSLAKIYFSSEYFDSKKAKEYNQILTKSGDSEAMWRLAELLYSDSGNDPYCKDEVISLYRRSHEAGCVLASEKLASLYFNKKISNPNTEEQERLFSMMADKGQVDYQLALGILCMDDKSAFYNPEKAFGLLKKASSSNNATASYYLGKCYEHGIGTEKDLTSALTSYEKAGKAGNIEAQTWLKAYKKRIEQERILQEERAREQEKKRIADIEKSKRKNDFIITLPNGTEMRFVKISAGSFKMGSPVTEQDRESDEAEHIVTLPYDYWIGIYEITQEQYASVMGSNPSKHNGTMLPVDSVSWMQAMAFCKKLNSLVEKQLPKNYNITLPTEAQWEYACRAGTTTAFSFGNDYKGIEINSSGVYPYQEDKKEPVKKETTPVNNYPSNPWGIFDMHGNVYEWCLNGNYVYETEPDALYEDPYPKAVRMLRGGAYNSVVSVCRSAHRYNFDQRDGFETSFRVVISPKIKKQHKKGIPSDYAIYLPLATSWTNTFPQSGVKVQCLSGPRPQSNLLVDGIRCTFLEKATRIIVKDVTNISQRNHSRAISIWCKNKQQKNDYWHAIMVFCGSGGAPGCYRDLICMRDYGNYSCYSNDGGRHVPINTNQKNDDKWHHFISNYNSNENEVSFFIDGNKIGAVRVKNSQWNLTTGGIVIGGKYPTPNEYEDLYVPAFFAGFRIYNRALSQAEISALAHEFMPRRH